MLSLCGLLASHIAVRRDLQYAQHRLATAANRNDKSACIEAALDLDHYEVELLEVEKELCRQLGAAFRPAFLAK